MSSQTAWALIFYKFFLEKYSCPVTKIGNESKMTVNNGLPYQSDNLEVITKASQQAEEFTPNQEYYRVESSEYDVTEQEWYIQIDTPDELLGICCYFYEGEIYCSVVDTGLPLSRKAKT